jgi:multiple sugar transport system permease protein
VQRRSRLFYIFLLLPLLYLLALIGVPIVYTLVMSVQEVTLGNIADFVRPFVGLDNFKDGNGCSPPSTAW